MTFAPCIRPDGEIYMIFSPLPPLHIIILTEPVSFDQSLCLFDGVVSLVCGVCLRYLPARLVDKFWDEMERK